MFPKLIGGPRTNGQVMATYVHNSKNTALNKTLRFENPDQALNLSRLVVLTTRSSASASELVINSLRPYIPVAIVGDTTYGKPVGQYGLPFCDKVLAPVSFALKNVNNEGDFFDGLAPTCTAGDDITHQLGDPAEGSFAEAITYLRTGAYSSNTGRAATTLRALATEPRLGGWRSLINAW